MVRLIPVERRGRVEWIEDAPKQCAQGHTELAPNWEPCPVCGEMVRSWPCRAEGCTAPLQIDDEHVHHGRRGVE
jgi:hypothetical protein